MAARRLRLRLSATPPPDAPPRCSPLAPARARQAVRPASPLRKRTATPSRGRQDLGLTGSSLPPYQLHSKSSSAFAPWATARPGPVVGWHCGGHPFARQYATNPALRTKSLNRAVLRTEAKDGCQIAKVK